MPTERSLAGYGLETAVVKGYAQNCAYEKSLTVKQRVRSLDCSTAMFKPAIPFIFSDMFLVTSTSFVQKCC
jgi:hypothetical protein